MIWIAAVYCVIGFVIFGSLLADVTRWRQVAIRAVMAMFWPLAILIAVGQAVGEQIKVNSK